MKYVSFVADGRTGFGTLAGDEIAVLGGEGSGDFATLRNYLDSQGPNHALSSGGGKRLPLAGLTFAPVLPDPGLIYCIGLNYANHLAEMGREPPKFPSIFSRTPRSQIGHGEAMVVPRVSTQLDYEGELAVVIGRGGRYIAAAHALDHIAGYSCYNDGSLRDFQRHTIQFTPGKNFWATGAFGPWLVTPDEFGAVADHSLTTRLNGKVVQQSQLDDLIFGVPELIAYISSFTELQPGDVIVTGTPGGVGAARKPPLFMAPGDVVEVEIDGIGILRNPVVAEADVTVPGFESVSGR